MPKMPSVRETEEMLEIDAKRGEWPFMRLMRADDGSGRLFLMIDCNQGGTVIGEGRGIGVLVISKKKARRLQEFLERTDV